MTRKARLLVVSAVLAGCLAASSGVLAKQWDGDMTLQRALAVAVDNNPSYVSAKLEVDVKTSALSQTQGQEKPQVSVGFTESTDWNDDPGSELALTLSQDVNGFHPLFASPKYPQPLIPTASAGIAIKQAQASLDVARASLIYNVTEGYYGVLEARSLVDVQKAGVDAANAAKADAQARLTAGTGTNLDVLLADVEVSNAQLALDKAQNAVIQAERDFFALLGVDAPSAPVAFATPDTASDPPDIDVQKLTDQALKARPEMTNAKLKVDLATSTLNEARRGQLPTVSLTTTYTEDHVSGDVSWEPLTGKAGWGIDLKPTEPLAGNSNARSNGWESMLNVTYPLFDAGVQANVVKQSDLTLQQVQLSYDDTVSQVKSDVLKATLAVTDAKHSLDAQAKATAQTAETRRLTELRVRNGIGTTRDLIDANKDLTTAQVNLTKAQFQYQIALASLRKAIAQDKED